MAATGLKLNFPALPTLPTLKASLESINAATNSAVNFMSKNILNPLHEVGGSPIPPKVVTGLSGINSSVAITKDILVLSGSRSAHSAGVPLGCAYSGIGLVLGALVTLPTGVVDLHKSNKIHDGEGMRRASQKIVLGSFMSTASALSLASVFGSVLSTVPTPFFLVAIILSILSSSLTIYRCATFSSEINKKLSGSNNDLIETLKFLKEKIAPTEEEISKIREEVQRSNPNLSADVKVILIDQKIADLTKVKIKYVARRSNHKVAESLAGNIDEAINSKDTAKASKLIAELKNGINKNISITSVGLFSSCIALVALVLASFFSFGTLPYALFLISAIISLGLIIYPFIEDRIAMLRGVGTENQSVARAPVNFSASDSGPMNHGHDSSSNP